MEGMQDKVLLTLHDVTTIDQLRCLLASGSNINESNNFDETPLLCVLRRDVDMELIKHFLENGADVNAKDCWGVTPLYCAVARHGNNLDLIKILLDFGADIKSGKRINDRFLDHTVTHRKQCAKLLIKYKFLKNYKLISKFTSESDIKLTSNPFNDFKDIVDLDLKPSSYDFLSDFLKTCALETFRMTNKYLTRNLTFMHFITRQYPEDYREENHWEDQGFVQSILDDVYKEMACYNYIVFRDIILSKIRRENLMKKVNVLLMNYVQKEYVGLFILNEDLMDCVSKFLNDEDLLNLVLCFLTKCD